MDQHKAIEGTDVVDEALRLSLPILGGEGKAATEGEMTNPSALDEPPATDREPRRIDATFAAAPRPPIALLHGGFYVVAGLWPVVHMRSFEAVTGRKRERWLAKTVGLLIAVVGAGLLRARRGELAGARRTAITAALALAGVDLVYVARRRISRFYLLDAAVQLGLAAGWLPALRRERAPGEAWFPVPRRAAEVGEEERPNPGDPSPAIMEGWIGVAEEELPLAQDGWPPSASD